ncbi:hypothetical protein OG730_41375 (plasmid) [Streptomyces sp. NBC_01298]|uniref:hypothetical protein n=1 Tax=unclassified Streptomyces TaxID=2593676 RepID=UPI002E164D05|nr:hypothetical protein OG730_42650 [Streptomyces sp. NBC_01298]WSK25921.1 hypothetical protein OG730_41375 [Streptomyces sp. NBC_01298]
MIHHTPEAIQAEMQERLRVAGHQRLVAAAAAERRRQRRARRAARPGWMRRAVRTLRRAAAEGLRVHDSIKQQEGAPR